MYVLTRKYAHLCITLCTVMLVFFALISCDSSAPPPQKKTTLTPQQKLDAYIAGQVQQKQFRGVVLVVVNDKVVLEKGYDFADVQQQKPNTPQTVFPLTQVTKQFTAIAILLLQEQGKLHVQDSICQYVKQCPDEWKQITIKDLLTEYSDLPDITNTSLDLTKPDAPDALLTAVKDVPIAYPPHTRVFTSYTNYLLLGMIIEKVSGQSYANFLQKSIFTPLQLQHTSSLASTSTSASGMSTGYIDWQTPITPAYQGYVNVANAFASGSISSTVDDLYALDKALGGTMLLSQSSLQTLFTTAVPFCSSGSCSGPAGNYADFGLGYGDWVGSDNSNHTGKLGFGLGFMNGYAAYNGYYPDKHAAVIILSNLGSLSFESVLTLAQGIEAKAF